MYKQLVIFLLLTVSTLAPAQQPDTPEKDYSAELPRIKALSPEKSQQQFEVLDGFEVKLVACEPLVVDPVAFAFDAKGQLWVVEMRDYSEQDKERLGRVAVLRDTNGDGVMDSRSTFVENLSWPTAIWPWLDGVVMADAPQLTWHRDTDGDLVADKSETWYTGFGRSNVQGLINSFRWGVDGWIHGVTSSSGAELEAADGAKIALGRRDFGIDPLTHELRPETGGGQHGMSFNRWGDKFATSNSDHLQQIVDIESWLGNQSNQVAMPAVRRSIAEDGPQAEVFRASPVEPWRIVRTRLRMSGVAPGIVEGGGRAAGYFTGATGTAILDRELGFGSVGEPHDTAIVCDVGSNLVHRKRLVDQGFFFSGQRLDQQTELLRSRDIWFRPVQIGEGPDGALYIADMYREVIEHPASLPPMIKKHLDLTSGRDKGRIWRLSPKSMALQPISNMAAMSDEQLVERLNSSVAYQRLMASQTLTERFASKQLHGNTFDLLQKSAASAARPEARLLSLHLLSRMNRWDVQLADMAAKEKHPRVLAQAIELIGHTGHAKGVSMALRNIASDSSDNRVQLALAKTSVVLEPDDRQALLTALLPKQTDPLVRAVIATAAGKDSWKLLHRAKQIDDASLQQWLVLWLPLWTADIKNNAELAKFVADSLQADNPRRSAWLGGLSRVNSPTQVTQLLAAANAQAIIDNYLTQELEQSVSNELVRWLRLASPELQSKWLEKLIHPSTGESLQIVCIDSLSWSNHSELPAKLIANFRSLTPSVQLAALRSIVSRQDRLPQLIEALKQQQISRSQIPTEIRQSLVSQRDKAIAEQFKSLLDQASTDRSAVLQRYAESIERIAEDAQAKTKGTEVFQRVCAQCHRLGDIGNDVGPPLKQLGDKSPQQLLESILDPSREVDPKYMGYTILLEDGVVINAIILQESGQQIVVGEPGGKQTTIDRRSIEEMKSSGLSLMPNGLEEQVTPQQMTELIRFLKSP
jgi:putative membrane-bound dehydrogenase-like protein